MILEEKSSIFGGKSISRFEKKDHMNRCIILNVYRNRPLESTNIKSIVISNFSPA